MPSAAQRSLLRMRLEWLEDILAIMEHGSLQKASEHRFLTQSAFSRRIALIEDYLRAPILDRSTKPAQLRPAVLLAKDRIQQLSLSLRALTSELRYQPADASKPVVLVSQHSITTSHGHILINQLSPGQHEQITLRSENWDACFKLLMSKEADIAITYGTATIAPLVDSSLLEQHVIGLDRLVPVFGTAHRQQLDQALAAGQLPIIAYPQDVFMGTLMHRDILPRLDNLDGVRHRTETALTIAALHMAAAGLGVAWVPHTLARRPIEEGQLTELSDQLPSAAMQLIARRLKGPATEQAQHIWQVLTSSEL